MANDAQLVKGHTPCWLGLYFKFFFRIETRPGDNVMKIFKTEATLSQIYSKLKRNIWLTCFSIPPEGKSLLGSQHEIDMGQLNATDSHS
jgi:hypothetical protein